MKTDTVFKQSYNTMLERLSVMRRGDPLPSENDLSSGLGVSRTTIRKVLDELSDRGYVKGPPRGRSVGKAASPNARFPIVETVPPSEQVERRFMEWMLRGDSKPGAQINELDLARQFGVGTSAIREFLNRFRRFGLIEKRANAGWVFKGFTQEFAMDLFEIREMFEIRSARAFAALSTGAASWASLAELKTEHQSLLANIDARFHDFSDLDNRFHRLINAAKPNRFIDDFYDIITFIFHYHYQWNKRDERQRNEVAIGEHLAYIDALLTRDRRHVEATCRAHLASAKQTLMTAFSGG
jgi:DNA-binding GntR family transcriptional regulator